MSSEGWGAFAQGFAGSFLAQEARDEETKRDKIRFGA